LYLGMNRIMVLFYRIMNYPWYKLYSNSFKKLPFQKCLGRVIMVDQNPK